MIIVLQFCRPTQFWQFLLCKHCLLFTSCENFMRTLIFILIINEYKTQKFNEQALFLQAKKLHGEKIIVLPLSDLREDTDASREEDILIGKGAGYYSVLRIRIRWIRKVLASWIRIRKNIWIPGSGSKELTINQKLKNFILKTQI